MAKLTLLRSPESIKEHADDAKVKKELNPCGEGGEEGKRCTRRNSTKMAAKALLMLLNLRNNLQI
jgi:hypothetical protein